MATLKLIACVFALVFLVRLLMSICAAAARIARGGATEAAEFDRAGFGVRSFLLATTGRQDTGSLVPTRAGLDARVRDGRIVVVETRAVSKEVF